MYYEFSISEEERVAFNFPGGLRDLDALLVSQFGEIVDKLPRVGAAGDDKTEFEVVGADHLAPEVVPLNHLHLINGLGTVRKVQRQTDRPQ